MYVFKGNDAKVVMGNVEIYLKYIFEKKKSK
jgi:hypothetical protein